MGSLDWTHLVSHIPCAESWTLNHPAATEDYKRWNVQERGNRGATRSGALAVVICGKMSLFQTCPRLSATTQPLLQCVLIGGRDGTYKYHLCRRLQQTNVRQKCPLKRVVRLYAAICLEKYATRSHKVPDMLPDDMHLSREALLLCSWLS